MHTASSEQLDVPRHDLRDDVTWSKGVEWPAKRRYVGLVAVGVQEQAQDILVPPLLRNC